MWGKCYKMSQIRLRHTMTRARIAKGMSAEVCVSDTGLVQLLLETDVLSLHSKSCCSVFTYKCVILC